MMITILYTGKVAQDIFEPLLLSHLPNVQIHSILDPSLLNESIFKGTIPANVQNKLRSYIQLAQNQGSTLFVNTCSSLGEEIESLRSKFSISLFRIDEPMAELAVQESQNIAVLATLQTTLTPTLALLNRKAKICTHPVQITPFLTQSAFDALMSGNKVLHDTKIIETAIHLPKEMDAIVLAQGSMSLLADEIAQKTGKRVFSSPLLCVQKIKEMYSKNL